MQTKQPEHHNTEED
jgi:hypothetical protein